MLHKIKRTLAAMVIAIVLAMPLAVPSVAFAQQNNITNGTCTGANTLQITTDVNGGCGAIQSSGGVDKVNTLITNTINVISVIVGIIAVVMIIIGGLQYVTSGGSAERVGKAKNTILYALIGLIIVALAQVIVRFVLQKVTQ